MTESACDGSAPRDTYASVLRRLTAAQKSTARSAPAYSRFVNRRLGRYITAWAYLARITPNAVTAISAVWTFSGVILVIVFPASWGLGVAVAVLLLIGYAFDSADGQLSRLTGRSSPAGEWLDHMVDATKVVSMPLALAVGFFVHRTTPTVWLIVPLLSAVVASVLFFGMILTEQLRRRYGSVPVVAETGRPSWRRAVLVLPMDYGVLCASFVLLGWVPGFAVVYTLIVIATTLFLLAAAVRWFSELRNERSPL